MYVRPVKSLPVLIVAIVGSLIGGGCERDIECSVTAESLAFSLIDSTGAFILTKADTNTVAITYLDTNNIFSIVPDIRITETVVQDLYNITSVEIVNLAYQDRDRRFTLTYDDQTLGQITLDTYQNNAFCDPWYATSALLFNGDPVEQNPTGTYLIEVNF